MPRFFVLCDPNIVKTGGHYLEYAKMVIEAAQAQGYQPVLAVNENCRIDPPEGWMILPVFEYGFWGRHLGGGAAADQRMTTADQRFLRLKYSRNGLLWNAAGDLGEVQHFNREYPPSKGTIERLRSLHELKALTDLFLQSENERTGGGDRAPEDWTPEDRERFYAALRDAIRSALATLKGKKADERALLAATTRSALTSADTKRDSGALQDLTSMSGRAASFARAMNRVLETVRPGPDSLILYPTINYFELRGLKEVLDGNPLAHAPSHHVILRRNAYNGYSGSFDEQEWQVHPVRTALALLNDVGEDTRLRFYTDTEPLTHQYNLFNTARFVTGPVPVDMVERVRPAPPRYDDQARPALLLVDATGLQETRTFLEQLEFATRDGAERFAVKVVVRDGTPLGTYLAAGLAGPRGFGDVEFILPEDVDGIASARYDAVAFGSWHESYGRLAMEALEQGRSLAVPPSSWIAQAMCREASAFHDDALKGAGLVANLDRTSLPWMHYDYATGAQHPVTGREWVAVKPGAATTVELDVPPGADTVRLLFRQFGPDAWRMPINLIAFFRRQDDLSSGVGRHDLALTGIGNGVASVVLPVPPNCARLALALCNFHFDAPIQIQVMGGLWATRNRHVPALPGGLMMPDLRGDFVNSWLTPLRTLLAARRSYGESGAGWMDPVALRRRVPPGLRPMVVSYLGDAREEKGFHRLPALVRRLAADPVCRDVIVKSQVYYTADYPEASCLSAAAILRTAPRDRVSLIERPLDSREYAREIMKSDAVLVSYRQHDYIARSSGIFTEALAGGIPVVIPSGTWMSAETDSFAYEQHCTLIGADRIVRIERPELNSFVGGSVWPIQRSLPAGTVPVTRGSITFVHVPVPDEVEYLWITYCPDPNRPRAFTRFDISFQDSFHGGQEIAKVKRVLGGGIATILSLVARVPKRANGVWIGMYNANGFEPYDLQNFALNFVRGNGPRVPEFAGGVTYFTGDDDAELDRNLAEAVHLLRRDYDLYAASAAAIQPEWAARHTPSRLVAMMEKPFTDAERAQRARFHGADW